MQIRPVKRSIAIYLSAKYALSKVAAIFNSNLYKQRA